MTDPKKIRTPESRAADAARLRVNMRRRTTDTAATPQRASAPKALAPTERGAKPKASKPTKAE